MALITSPCSSDDWQHLLFLNADRIGEEIILASDDDPIGDTRIIRISELEIVYLRYASYPMGNALMFFQYDIDAQETTCFYTDAEGLITI